MFYSDFRVTSDGKWYEKVFNSHVYQRFDSKSGGTRTQLPVVSKICSMSGCSACFTLAIIFLWDSDTPLDRPVVPLEYGINTTSVLRLVDGFRSDVSVDASIISPKSHVPSLFDPSRLTHTTNIGFCPGPSINFWAAITLGKSWGIVTTPAALLSFNWWAISTVTFRKRVNWPTRSSFNKWIF